MEILSDAYNANFIEIIQSSYLIKKKKKIMYCDIIEMKIIYCDCRNFDAYFGNANSLFLP